MQVQLKVSFIKCLKDQDSAHGSQITLLCIGNFDPNWPRHAAYFLSQALTQRQQNKTGCRRRGWKKLKITTRSSIPILT